MKLAHQVQRDQFQVSPYMIDSLRKHGGVLLVDCGYDHTVVVCGDLLARTWGRAQEGQLGIEHAGPPHVESTRGLMCVLDPTLIGLCEGELPASVQAIAALRAGEWNVAAIAAGGMHTLLMTLPRTTRDEPVLFSMGRGLEGQLGTGGVGFVEKSPEAQPITLPTDLAPTIVAAGGLHSAAVSSHGHAFLWGDPSCGQLGLDRLDGLPVQVPRHLRSEAFESKLSIGGL